MECNCYRDFKNLQLVHKIKNVEAELIDKSRQILKSASDPVSAVIRFLAERPEKQSMSGYLITRVLIETFGDNQQIPGLIRLMSEHVREIVRQANVIDIIKEHPTTEKWGNFIIKQKERIKFEVGLERGRTVLKNIHGLIGIEHGIEVPLERIQVSPPNLIVTVKLGCLRPQRIIEI